MLLHRAARLFSHVKSVLASTQPASAIHQDHSAVLRTQLLTQPAYCTATPTSTFQGPRPPQ